MDTTRFWTIVSAALIVLVVIMDAVFGIAPNLRTAEQARSDQATVDAANAGHSDELVALQAEQDGISDLERTLEQLQRAVPADAGLPDFVAQLGTIAEANGVLLTAISIGDAQAYAQAYAPTAASSTAVPDTTVPDAAAPDTTTDTATPDATPDATADAAAPAAASARLTSENFATMTVTLSLTGGYDNLLDFVEGLQSGDRLVSITNISSTGDSSVPGGVTGAVSFIIYVLYDEE